MRGYIGLGSNQGDRLANLRSALDRLAARGLLVVRCSSVYETEPVGAITDQQKFLNACALVETELRPQDLLDVCKRVEHELGRAGGPRHGPRPIDLDLLLLGELEYRSERLTVPHPEILSRRFVLVPLLELDPGLRLPDGRPLAGALDAVADQRLARVGEL